MTQLTRPCENARRAGSLRFRREENTKKKAEVVEQILERVEQKLGEGDVKATLSDYIRLVQLQKELEEDEPAEITVTWVDPEQFEKNQAEKTDDGSET